MYENNFSRNIDNSDYYVPQNYRSTYDNPYDARFVNSVPNNYYEDDVIPSYNRRTIQPYAYNGENYNYVGENDNYFNYNNISNLETKSYMEANNFPNINYAKDIELEGDFSELYPEIYKKIVPIVDNVIKESKIKKLNNGILDVLTLNVYDAFEDSETQKVNTDNITNISTNKNTNNISNSSTNTINSNIISKPNNNINSNSKYEANKIVNSVNTNSNSSKYEPSKISMDNTNNKNEQTLEVATRYRNIKNPTLRDLIRILILNRLFRNWNMPRPPRPRPYQNYSQIPFPTSNYNLVSRYEPNYNIVPDVDYTKSYFNSPYPEDN